MENTCLHGRRDGLEIPVKDPHEETGRRGARLQQPPPAAAPAGAAVAAADGQSADECPGTCSISRDLQRTVGMSDLWLKALGRTRWDHHSCAIDAGSAHQACCTGPHPTRVPARLVASVRQHQVRAIGTVANQSTLEHQRRELLQHRILNSGRCLHCPTCSSMPSVAATEL